MNNTYEIIGSIASPYSLKLRAILRYRRLPHVWRLRRPDMGPAIESVKPKLMPMLRFPDEERYRVDSTPLAYALEQRHPDSRSILPPSPAERFLCHLLEDFGDEWCTQLMYYYRWVEERTARFGAQLIIQDWLPEATGAVREKAEAQIFARQRSRMGFVCGEGNDAALAASYLDLLKILDVYAGNTRYLFGSRPSLADFALYGQLSQLAVDPLPQSLMREHGPRVEHWVRGLEDASGIEGGWNAALAGAAETRKALLRLAAHSYLPFMVANAAAADAGRESFEITVCGHAYRRAPFGYQAKCYREIQQRWRELTPEVRASLQPLLTDTGCLQYLDT